MIDELFPYSLGLLVYLAMSIHALSAVTRTRDESLATRLLMISYLAVVILGIPFVFAVWALTR